MLFVRAYPRETQEAKAIDEDIHQAQDGRLPAGLVVHVTHADSPSASR
jgi:hypothetical protein